MATKRPIRRISNKRPPEPEYNPRNVVVGGGILASIVTGFLLWGGGEPREVNTPQPTPEARIVMKTTATPQAITTAPSYTVERAAPAAEPITARAIETPAQPAEPAAVKTHLEAPKAVTSSPAIKSGFSALPVLVSKNQSGSETWHVGEHDYMLDVSTVRAFEKYAKKYSRPKEMFIAACARESRCKPDAENINIKTTKSGKKIDLSTHACGLFQLMPTRETQTLFRLAYEYGPENGYGYAQNWINKTKRDPKAANPIYDYAPKDKESRAKLMNLCMNADFNTAMFAQEKEREIKKYEEWLGNRHATLGEITIINNTGMPGMKRFAQQAWNDKKTGTNTVARDFFGKSISDQNPSLVEFPGKGLAYTGEDGKTHYRKNMTVRESYNNVINNFGGWRSSAEILAMNIN